MIAFALISGGVAIAGTIGLASFAIYSVSRWYK